MEALICRTLTNPEKVIMREIELPEIRENEMERNDDN